MTMLSVPVREMFNAEFAGRLRELATLVENGQAGIVAVDSRFDTNGLTLTIEVATSVQYAESMPRFRINAGGRETT